MADQLKASALGLYGNPDVRTPHLDRLAAQGVCFTRAYTPAPFCAPARVSFWTGRWPHQHGARTGYLLMPSGMDHYLARLDAAGYTLGLIGKNHCFQEPDLARFDTRYEAGHGGPFDTEGDPRVESLCQFFRVLRSTRTRTIGAVNPNPPEFCTTGLLAARADRFIRTHRTVGRPWALWLSIPDPHPPYNAPEPYASMFDPAKIALPPWDPDELASKPESMRVVYELMDFAKYTEADIRRTVATYYAMIAFIDDAAGRVLDSLEATGQQNDTIVVFTSDHGDYAGEHRMLEKYGGFYDCLTRVPLVVSSPARIPPGQVCPEVVSTMDTMATCFALAGLEGPPGISARPLPAPHLPGGGRTRDAVFAEWGGGGPLVTLAQAQAYRGPARGTWNALIHLRACQGRAKMVRLGRWKYCWDPLDHVTEARELYDLSLDPWELHNLAHEPSYAERCTLLERRLLRWSVLSEDAEAVPLPFDRRTLEPSDTPSYAQEVE